MGKIALLVSREEMLYQAHNILQEKKFEISEMRAIQTQDAVMEARKSISNGASLIIARGLQASLIKQYTDIPVAEIVITAQEMALLIIRAKQILKKERPVIAVVGFRNMFCDMSYFDMIYDIELRTYFSPTSAELENVSLKAVQDQADLIIGGDTAVKVATEHEIPSLFLSTTEDSLRNAFVMAESMNYAMGMEKRNAAQFETVLDNSFNGVLRADADGHITGVNPVMENILEAQSGQIKGKHLRSFFRDIDQETLQQILDQKKDSFSMFTQVKRNSIFAILAPITIDGRVDGMILTCNKVSKRRAEDQDNAQKSKRSSGLIALGKFDDISQLSKQMQACVHRAKLYSMSDKPVVLIGEPGTEKRLMAQSIHNSSDRGDGPFCSVTCSGLSDAVQSETIFGEKGAALLCDRGTLLLEDIENLSFENQNRLYQMIRYKRYPGKDLMHLKVLDVRVIAASAAPLEKAVEAGLFSRDLYYLLQGLVLEIPPMRQRQEDLKKLLEDCIHDCCERYTRYHVLTSGAKKALMDYRWEGNIPQIENFCEHLILTATKRSLDEIAVGNILKDLYPRMNRAEAISPAPPTQAGRLSAEAAAIVQALRENGGSREKTAKALGISKATLWRHMKKYGIE